MKLQGIHIHLQLETKGAEERTQIAVFKYLKGCYKELENTSLPSCKEQDID